jgi:hypothetical protein
MEVLSVCSAPTHAHPYNTLIVHYLFPTCIGTFTTIPIKHKYSKLPYCESTTIPAQACYRSIGSQEVEAPGISRQSAHEGGKVVSSTDRPTLPSRKYSWYSFLLETESTPGRIMSIKNSSDAIGNRTSEYVILFAFPLQQWLRERASMLRYT